MQALSQRERCNGRHQYAQEAFFVSVHKRAPLLFRQRPPHEARGTGFVCHHVETAETSTHAGVIAQAGR
jgi:hypothetical protein